MKIPRMTCEKFSSSTFKLKISFFVLIVVLSLQVSGFFLPRWSSFQFNVRSDWGISEVLGRSRIAFYVGLWEDCIFAAIFLADGTSLCLPKHISGLFTAVQVLETIGLLGLFMSGFITCVALVTRQDKQLKVFNILTAFVSGVSIVIGVILYAAQCKDQYNDLFDYVTGRNKADRESTKLDVSFILCTTAGALCLFGLTASLLWDFLTAPALSHTVRQQQSVPVSSPYQIESPDTVAQLTSTYPSPPAYAESCKP